MPSPLREMASPRPWELDFIDMLEEARNVAILDICEHECDGGCQDCQYDVRRIMVHWAFHYGPYHEHTKLNCIVCQRKAMPIETPGPAAGSG